jgi:hypothetical protein
MTFLRPALLLALSLAFLPSLAACDRNLHPYDPNEKVEQPDLSKIFPEGAERTAEGVAMGGGGRPGAMPGAAAPARGSQAPLRGTVRLAREVEGRAPSGAVLFVIARVGEAGPPTAVLRVPDAELPFEFAIGPENRMIEALPFDGPFTLTARLDADGNAASKNPGDLQGQAPGTYAPGDREIEIVIDEIL